MPDALAVLLLLVLAALVPLPQRLLALSVPVLTVPGAVVPLRVPTSIQGLGPVTLTVPQWMTTRIWYRMDT
jgi:hypothetical protein